MKGENNIPKDTKGTLWLLPVALSSESPSLVLPDFNLGIIGSLRYFIVENVRTARRFIKRCNPAIDISALNFSVLDEHSDESVIDRLLAPIEDGHDIGLMSEAGCPGVADPGALAVKVAQQRGYRIRPLVGPSSILLSLMASGFNGQSFAFVGYLPVEQAARADRLRQMVKRIRNEHQTQIFIETPYRNNKLIDELCKTLPGDMSLCIASDITGSNENIITRPVSEWSCHRPDLNKVPTIYLLY